MSPLLLLLLLLQAMLLSHVQLCLQHLTCQQHPQTPSETV
jgi:hypothetical protein